MKTDRDLWAEYKDVLEDGDDAPMLQVVRKLDTTCQDYGPSTQFVAETAAVLEERIQSRHGSRLRRRLPALLRERPLAAASALLLLMLVLAGTAYAVGEVIHVFPPEKRISQNVIPLGFLLPPPGAIHYRAIDPARAARESGLPIAYLSSVPADLSASVGTDVFSPIPWTNSDARIQWHDLSLVRYRGEGHTLVIGLSEPSPSVIANHQVLLGEHTVHLPNGQDGWSSTQPESTEPNWVTTVSGRYIVTLQSDLSLDRVEQLAVSVTVAAPSGHSSPTGIPATWPSPLPADSPIPGVDIALLGKVGHDVSQGVPQLSYFLKIGNRGQGHEQHVAITFILPSGITFANQSPANQYTVHFGSGNGGIGGTVPIAVDDGRAFDQGVDARVTWTEDGKDHSRIFHFVVSEGDVSRGGP